MDFLCREHSSVGLERLLDKQEVCGSNPHVPTSFEAFVRRFGQRLFFVARLGKRAACRNGPQQTPPPPKIPLGPRPPATPKIRLEPLPPAVPQPCPRAALRHAPHPKKPRRLHSKNVRLVGRSGSAAARSAAAPFHKAARAASRHAPHPKTPRRLRGKDIRFAGRSGSAALPQRATANAAAAENPSRVAAACHAATLSRPPPLQARRRSPPRTPSLCGTPCVYASTASRKRESPCFSAEAFGEKLGRDDWIRTSDNTPPRRVL